MFTLLCHQGIDHSNCSSCRTQSASQTSILSRIEPRPRSCSRACTALCILPPASHYGDQHVKLLQFAKTFKDRALGCQSWIRQGNMSIVPYFVSETRISHMWNVISAHHPGRPHHVPPELSCDTGAYSKRSWIAAFDGKTTGVHHPALEHDRNHHSLALLSQLPPLRLTLRPARIVCTGVTSVM